MAGEKRNQDQDESHLKENIIIVDIEGTTTSISFVKDTLFPYVRENVKKYLDAKWEDEEFKSDLQKLKEQAKKDEEDKIEGFVPISGSTTDEEKESTLKNILWQMDGDRKTGALKQLQGHMWRKAYESGDIKGHVYEDVPECLKSWKNCGKKIYVYSSGSVEAQKLLFGHSKHGNLLEYFSGYFDTQVGMKQEAASYKKILNEIKAEASDVIFLTDIVKEATAAKEAGLSTIIMIREGNAPLSDEEKTEFKTATSFLDLTFLNAAKRQKLNTPENSKEKIKIEPVVEKMEISEDVEMKDVSGDKENKTKVETVGTKVETESNEVKENKDSQVAALASETKVEKEEAMETDSKSEVVKKIDETVESAKPAEENKEVKVETVESEKESKEVVKEDGKSEEVNKTVDKEAKASHKSEETSEKTTSDETDKVTQGKSEKIEVSGKQVELSKEKTDPVKSETASAADEAMEEVVPTADTKSTKVTDVTTEIKTEGTDKSSEPLKDKLGKMETEKKKTELKPNAEESCPKIEASLSKEAEKLGNIAEEPEKKAIQPNETSTKVEETVPKSDKVATEETIKENGTAKTEPVTKTENETAAADNKDGSDVKKTESKVEETAMESKDSEIKIKDETKAEDSVAAEAKKEVETKEVTAEKSGEEKESEKGVVKNETETSKDTMTVTEPVKKINGTTQNGETVTDDENKKVHTNGVNDACTSNATDSNTKTEVSPQVREPESSTDASAESIKVKKVVDSTVADGAGEPDVVPPAVVVTATS